MITKALTRRLALLEQQTVPAGEPHTINIKYVNPDGTEAPGGYTITVPAARGQCSVHGKPFRGYR